MSKRIRQYIGLLAAIVAYYAVHEGTHLVYALCTGVFKQIRFLGLGVQIDVQTTQMTSKELGVFCLLGSVATAVVAYALVILARLIKNAKSKVFKACMYYVTIAMLLIDPLYLSLLCGFFGGGDMNGISLLAPEWAVRIGYGALLLINVFLFYKIVLPQYKLGFAGENGEKQ